MKLNRYWAACLLMLLLTVTPVSADWFSRNKIQTGDPDWQTLITPHYEITYADGADELAVRASIIAERAYREYADRLNHELEKRIPFVLYSSHAAFASTNISDQLLGEGTGGFTEPARNRMVLPYEGSHADFVHVIRHELVHVFMFDITFGSSRKSGARGRFFHIPLWFAEGMAEWYATGWDASADMYLRDATTSGYLWPLDRVGGFMVYKEGQAAMRLISETYGEEKLVQMWHTLGRSRNMDRTMDAVLGLDMKALNEAFEIEMRERYWSLYGSMERPEEIARSLNRHMEDGHGFNQRPALSPDGNTIAYFTDRDGLVDLYLMSALDGKVLHKVATGHRSDRFESMHSFRSGISFSPDGSEIALIARSGSRETLHTLSVENGRVLRSLDLGLDGATGPAWSPDGSRIAVAGTRLGRTDLYMIDLTAAEQNKPLRHFESREIEDGVMLYRITDDIDDEATPAWSPDGKLLAYPRSNRSELDYEFEVDEDGNRRLVSARFRNGLDATVTSGSGRDLVLLDPHSGESVVLKPEAGNWLDPEWLDNHRLLAVDNRHGVDNLSELTLDAQRTSVLCNRTLTNVAGAAAQPTYAAQADRLVFASFREGGWDLFAVDNYEQWSQRKPEGEHLQDIELEPPVLVTSNGGPRPVSGDEPIGTVRDYKPKLHLDSSGALGGGAVYMSPQAGLGMANVLHFSDMLGDYRLSALLNIYGSIENSDLALSYAYLKRRMDFGAGLFHYQSYYNSMFTSVGEVLPYDVFFSERNFGAYMMASYPFSTFRRVSLQLTGLALERTDYTWDPTGYYLVASDKQTHYLFQPSLSFVHDSAFYGYYGPVTGSRFLIQYDPALGVTHNSLSRQTLVADYRRYWMPARRNTIAVRFLGAVSGGKQPRAFVLGGPFTLRSHDFYDYRTQTNLAGPKMAMVNLEYRLPLLDALIFGWPGRWGLGPFGASVFFDMGATWYDTFSPFGHNDSGQWGFRDLRGGYGIGIRTRLGFLPLRFDWARPTDLHGSGDTIFHFSIGPEF
jgi:Tol biopolymer transport system component